MNIIECSYVGAARSLSDVLAADVATSKKAVELMRQYDQTSDASLTLSFQGTASISTSISSESGDHHLSTADPSKYDKHHRYSNSIKNKRNSSNNDSDGDDSDAADDYSYIPPLTSNLGKVFTVSKTQVMNKVKERAFSAGTERSPPVENFEPNEERWHDDLENQTVMEEIKIGEREKHREIVKEEETDQGRNLKEKYDTNDKREKEEGKVKEAEKNLDENESIDSNGSGPIRFQLTSRILDSTSTRAVMAMNYDSSFDSHQDARTNRTKHGSRTNDMSTQPMKKDVFKSVNLNPGDDSSSDSNSDSDDDESNDGGDKLKNKMKPSSKEYNSVTYIPKPSNKGRLISGNTINNNMKEESKNIKFQSSMYKRDLIPRDEGLNSVFSNSTSSFTSSSLISVRSGSSNSTSSSRSSHLSSSSSSSSSSVSSSSSLISDRVSDHSSQLSRSGKIVKNIERTLKNDRRSAANKKNKKVAFGEDSEEEEDDDEQKGTVSSSASSDSESRREVEKRSRGKIALNTTVESSIENDNDANNRNIKVFDKKNENYRPRKMNKMSNKSEKKNSDSDTDSDSGDPQSRIRMGSIIEENASRISSSKQPIRLWRPS